MRDCYKRFWKPVLIEKLRTALPEFALSEGPARQAADELRPSSKPVKFVCRPLGKLTFLIEFSAPGKQDEFGADFAWSEQGSQSTSAWVHDDNLFADSVIERPQARVMMQTLSRIVGDTPRVFWWSFWQPIVTSDEHDKWMAEFIAEELRVVDDAQAKQRVEAAVDAAIMDIQRCAMPWFNRKRDEYRQKMPAAARP